MDNKVKLLQEFFAGMQKDKVKVETKAHGFDYLEELVALGAVLEYCQLSLNLVHKYRLLQVPPGQLTGLLQDHVKQQCNVCLYFSPEENTVFCLNLDNNHKDNDREVIPEMVFAVNNLTADLAQLGICPLIIVSGRGYHIWCRLAQPVNNEKLHWFLLRLVAKTMAAMHNQGYDYQMVKFNMYPNNKIVQLVSIRLFGSKHVNNEEFSSVFTVDGLLSEAESWDFFADYVKNHQISPAVFAQAAQILETTVGKNR
jgi:hypothetical protein